jgi:hypothetical protein
MQKSQRLPDMACATNMRQQEHRAVRPFLREAEKELGIYLGRALEKRDSLAHLVITLRGLFAFEKLVRHPPVFILTECLAEGTDDLMPFLGRRFAQNDYAGFGAAARLECLDGNINRVGDGEL